MREENRDGEGECYQVSSGVEVVYSDEEKSLTTFNVNGKVVEDEDCFKICLQGYHVSQLDKYLNITENQLRKSGKVKVVATSAKSVLEEYLRNNQNIDSKIENRFLYT